MDGEIDDVSAPLESVVRRFGAMLRRVAKGRGFSDADVDELCQEVRIRLWHALRTGDRITDARASYVYRTALSAAVDIVRRHRIPGCEELDVATPPPEAEASAPFPDAELEVAELAERIDAAIDCLHSPRDVVVRLYLAGQDRATIASLLGWTEAKTRNLLYRGLADLRANLVGLGIGPERVS